METVAEEFLSLRERLDATEILVRPRLPGVDPAQARASIELFGEVATKVAGVEAVAR